MMTNVQKQQWKTARRKDIFEVGSRKSDDIIQTSDFGLRTSDFGLQTSDFGLRTSDFRLPTYHTQIKHITKIYQLSGNGQEKVQ
jgi:hypothetical protein